MGPAWLRVTVASVMLFFYVTAITTFTPLGCSLFSFTDPACTAAVLSCQNCTNDLYKLLIASYLLNKTKEEQDTHIKNLKSSIKNMKKTNQYLGRFVPAMEFVLSINDADPPPRFKAKKLTKILKEMPYRQYYQARRGDQKRGTLLALAEEAKVKQVRSWAQLREIRHIEDQYMASIKKMNVGEALSFYIFMRAYNMSLRNEVIGSQTEILRARAIWPGAISK